MSNEQLIKSWKNPEMRAKSNQPHPSGTSFGELSIDEMIAINGATDVAPQSTPFCMVSAAITMKFCVPVSVSATVSAGASAVVSIVTHDVCRG